VVALEEVDREKVSRYGVISGKMIGGDRYLIEDFVEKPTVEEAPSNLAIAGRYIFTSEIYDYIDRTAVGKNNELQITDAMRLMVSSRAMYGLRFDGRRHDMGNRLDFLKTNVLFALQRDDLRDGMREFLKDLSADL